MKAIIVIDVDEKDIGRKVNYISVQGGGMSYIVKQGEPILMDAFQLTTKDRYLCFDFYYELEDPSCTIDNINNATGTDVTLKLYGYVTE